MSNIATQNQRKKQTKTFPKQQKKKKEITYNKTQRERLIFLFLNLVGQLVDVQVTDGSIYEGIFHTCQVDKDFAIVLKIVRIKNPSNLQDIQYPIDTFIIQGKDIVQIKAADITFASENQLYRDETFITDTEISKNRLVGKRKELVAWKPDENDAKPSEELLLPEVHGNTTWDQFAVNYEKFGVTSTYDERLYTTELDKNSAFYKKNAKHAARIAKEIESEQTDNIQLAIERGQREDDSEEIYSSVIRPEPKQQPEQQPQKVGKYIPPQKRPGYQKQKELEKQKQEKQKQAQKSAKERNKEEKEKERQQKEKERQQKEKDKEKERQQKEKEGREKMIKEMEELEQMEKQKEKEQEIPIHPIHISPRQKPELKIKIDKTETLKKLLLKKPLVSKELIGGSPTAPQRLYRSNSFNILHLKDEKTRALYERERMRLRNVLVTERARSGSIGCLAPGSPTGSRSPLNSPLLGDANRVDALNLTPATPKVSEEVYKEYIRFTETEKQKKLSREAEIRSLKEFSMKFKLRPGLEKSKPGTLFSIRQHSAPNLSPILKEARESKPPKPTKTKQKETEPKQQPAKQQSQPKQSKQQPAKKQKQAKKEQATKKQQPETKKEQPKKEQGKKTPSKPAQTGKQTTPKGTEQKQKPETKESAKPQKKTAEVQTEKKEEDTKPLSKAGLNVNAKEFKFNPNASAFIPSAFKQRIAPSIVHPQKHTSWAFPIANGNPINAQYCATMRAKTKNPKLHEDATKVSPLWPVLPDVPKTSYKVPEELQYTQPQQQFQQFVPQTMLPYPMYTLGTTAPIIPKPGLYPPVQQPVQFIPPGFQVPTMQFQPTGAYPTPQMIPTQPMYRTNPQKRPFIQPKQGL